MIFVKFIVIKEHVDREPLWDSLNTLISLNQMLSQ